MPVKRGSIEYERRMLLKKLLLPFDARVEPPCPLTAYSLLFCEILSINIQRRVRTLYCANWKMTAADAGHVYVFRDTRDGSASIVKIGSTTAHDPEHRIAQWRKTLHTTSSSGELFALFTFTCVHALFAEKVIQALLFCQWLPKRVNARSGARLLEYFDVSDLRALEMLCRAVVRHVDWYCGVKNRQATMYNIDV